MTNSGDMFSGVRGYHATPWEMYGGTRNDEAPRNNLDLAFILEHDLMPHVNIVVMHHNVTLLTDEERNRFIHLNYFGLRDDIPDFSGSSDMEVEKEVEVTVERETEVIIEEPVLVIRPRKDEPPHKET